MDDGSSVDFLAVMDGHGGNAVSTLCLEVIESEFSLTNFANAEQYLIDFIAKLNKKTEKMGSGSTISLACISESEGRVAYAFLGDSPIIILDASGVLHTSNGHNIATNPRERQSAEKRGAVCDPYYMCLPGSAYGLQLTRALGDCALDTLLTREPETAIVPIGKDSLVVVASDGILGNGSKQNHTIIENVVQLLQEAEGIASDVSEWRSSVFGGLTDNLTVLVWK